MPTQPIPHAYRTIKEFERLVKTFSTSNDLKKKLRANILTSGLLALKAIISEPPQEIALLRRPIRYTLLPLTTDNLLGGNHTLYYKLTVEKEQTWAIIIAPPATDEFRIAVSTRDNQYLTDKEIEILLPIALEKVKFKTPSTSSLSYEDIAEELDACPTLIWSDGDLFYADPALKTIQHILPQQNTALFFELRSLFHAQLNQERIPVLSELLQNQYPNNTRLKSKEERFNATVWAILTLAEAESSSDSPSERITALATQFMETNIPPFTNSPDLFPDFPTLSLSLHYFLLKRRFETLEHTLRAKNPTFHLAFSDLKHQLLARFDNRPSGVFSFTRCTELIQNISVLWGKIQSKTITPSDIERFTKDTKPFQEHYRIKIAIMAIIGLLAGFIAGFFMGSLPGSLVGASAGGVLGSAIGAGIGFFSTSHDPLQRMNRIAQKEYKENCIFETSNGTISTINP